MKTDIACDGVYSPLAHAYAICAKCEHPISEHKNVDWTGYYNSFNVDTSPSPAIQWSAASDPTDWSAPGGSAWCPVWTQPLLMWALRRLGWKVTGEPGHWTAHKG